MSGIFASFSHAEICELFSQKNLPSYRAIQLADWVYQNLEFDFQSMTNLPKSLRDTLNRSFSILATSLTHSVTDSDGTVKFVFSLSDSHAIETVFMPGSTGYTLCISSQVGCALGCKFCATGSMGIIRNLSCGEIVSQVLHSRKITQSMEHGNIVFMGMGEPLLNSDAVFRAIGIFTDPCCMGWSPRRITVSTAGIVPEIQRLGQANLGINLAVSLNAPDDAIRSRIMPINRKYPLKTLMATLKEYPLASRQHHITYEYVMLRNINDQTVHADKLARLLDRQRDKVNLIPWNGIQNARFTASSEETILRFQERLTRAGIQTFIRKSRGANIQAACGQLVSRLNSIQD